jgi:8-oxo-dGTP diphosphatase
MSEAGIASEANVDKPSPPTPALPHKEGGSYVLVYGLSADPIHQQHVALVVDAARALLARGYALTKIILIPVYRRNPTGPRPKDDLPNTFEHRLAMCQWAAEEIARCLEGLPLQVEVSRIEEELAKGREAPNYTVETLSALQMREPGVGLIFLLGSDLVSGDQPELGRWREPEKLGQMALLAICPRPGYPPNTAFLDALRRQGAQVVILEEVTTRDMATSAIRQRLEAGEDALRLAEEGLLPLPVARYIHEHGLYTGQTIDHTPPSPWGDQGCQHPLVTVDVVIFTLRHDDLLVLLIQRGHPPFEGLWALPGGFVGPEETLEEAALRELEEETGVRDVYLEQLYTFGDPGRDPRGRVITVAYFALVPSAEIEVRGGNDARAARWWSVYHLPELAFDHARIVNYALTRLRYKLEYTAVGFQLLPDEFTLSELQRAYEVILGEKLDKRNFRNKLRKAEVVEPVNRRRESKGRPAQLYRFRPDAVAEIKARRLFP